MVKESWLRRYKAQFCVLALTVALLLAAVLGVGISARADETHKNYMYESDAGEYVRQQVGGADYTRWEQLLTKDIDVYCNGVVIKTFNNVQVNSFRSSNIALLARMYYFYLDLSSLKDDFYDFKLDCDTDAAFAYFGNDGLGFAVAFLGVDFSNCPRIICTAAETQPLPEEPEQEGYDFAGWYLDEEYTQPYEGTAIFGDITLYAKMDLRHYNINYIVWDGESAIAQNNVAHFSYLELPESPERAGYVFKGWTYADGAAYDNTEYVSSDLTLYAKWERQRVTVTFKMPDGTVYKELTVAYGTRLVDAATEAGVSAASFRAYYNDTVKLSRSYEITGNEVIEVKEMTKTEKTAAYISEHFGLVWATLGIIGGLILTAVISITVAVKRK